MLFHRFNKDSVVPIPPTTAPAIEASEWLTLSEASDLLGVHPTTLRAWADKGQVRTFRTPGGHRRFSAADLRRFLKVGSRLAPPMADPAEGLLAGALSMARRQVAELDESMPTVRGRFDEAERARKRESGRQLLALAIRYAARQGDHEQALAEARQLSRAYGVDAAQRGLRAVEVARLVCVFRGALLEALSTGPAGERDAHLREDIEHFMEEILFEMLDGHEGSSEK